MAEAPLISAIIEPVGGHGGMNYYDYGLCKGLASAGVKAGLYTCDSTVIDRARPFETRLLFRGIWGNGGKLGRGLKYLRGFVLSLRDARKRGCRIAHFHFFHTTALELAMITLARLYGLKTVITVHDVESFSKGSSKRLAKRVFGGADLLIVHNRISLEALAAIIPSALSRAKVIPHGNYMDFVKPVSREEAFKKIGLDAAGPVLLFWGQIKKVKGLDILISALPQVVKRFPGLKLVIAGKVWKDDFSVYGSAIEAHGLKDNVAAHIRYIPDEMAPYYFSAADIVVLPYRKIYQSGVLLMALSYGKAVVASDLPGMTEIIDDGVDGFTFRSEEPEDLARRVIEALSDKDALKRVASAGLRKATDGFSWARIGERTAEAYRGILD